MSKYYKLIKLSSKGFELTTTDINMIFDMLDSYVCTSCKVRKSEAENYCQNNPMEEFEQEYFIENAFPDNYDTLPVSDKVDWLMSTCCGAEFAYYEFDSYEDLLIDNKECAEWYMREYPEKFPIGE
jgi:hypothetical protein